MPKGDSSADQILSNLELLGKIGDLLEIDASQLENSDLFLTRLRQLQNVHHATQNRLDMFDLILPTVQQHFVEMTNLAKILNEKENSIKNRQKEKFDEIESIRFTTMAEMKFIENQLESFDVQNKPAVTHSNIAKIEKETENVRVELENLQQQIDYWIPSDEPTIESLTNKIDQVRDQLRNVEEEISLYVTDAFQLNQRSAME